MYHLTSRGVAQQAIFEDDADRRMMRKYLIEASHEYKVEIFAWCFMTNHIHLLAHAAIERISALMRDVLSRYARYFNARHARCGHLFQKRFGSVPIDSNEYLMVAVRYIHFNPSSMGISDLKAYKWSSYREYLKGSGLSSQAFVLSVFQGLEDFEAFHLRPNEDQETYSPVFEWDGESKGSADDRAIAEAKKMLGLNHLSEIAQADKATRDRMLALLKTRYSIRQISRITGIGRNVVQRANESLLTGESDSNSE